MKKILLLAYLVGSPLLATTVPNLPAAAPISNTDVFMDYQLGNTTSYVGATAAQLKTYTLTFAQPLNATLTSLSGLTLSGSASSSTFLRGDGQWTALAAGTAWGSITGTLASQTDLQTALNAKLSVTTAASTYVPQTATVNGHALSGNVTVTASDVGADASGAAAAAITWPTGPVIQGLFIGDSLTYGYGTQGTYNFTNTQNLSFSADLASGPLFANGSVFNTAYPGYTIAAIAAAYDPSPGLIQTTVTTTAGSGTATITGATTGLSSFMVVTSPNTSNPSSNSVGTYASISGTSLSLVPAATKSGSCTMTFGTTVGYPGLTSLTYAAPTRNPSGNGAWIARQIQPVYSGIPTYTTMWAGATDLGTNAVAGYATCSGSTITFATPTVANCSWTTSQNANGQYVITVPLTTSIASVVPGMLVNAFTNLTASTIAISQVDYAAGTIALASAPTGTGTNQTLTFSTYTTGAASGGYNAFFCDGITDAPLSGTVNGSGSNTINMTVNPTFTGTKLIVLCPQQTSYRTAYQTFVNRLKADNPANGVVIVSHQAYGGTACSAPIIQALCNGNSLVWNAWLRATYGNNAVTGVYLYDVATRAPFGATWSAVYGSQDGVHLAVPAHQFLATDLSAFLEATYSTVMSGPPFYPFNAKNSISRANLDAGIAYLDTANTWTTSQTFSHIATGGAAPNTTYGINNSNRALFSAPSSGYGASLETATSTHDSAWFNGAYSGAPSGKRTWAIGPSMSNNGDMVIGPTYDAGGFNYATAALTVSATSFGIAVNGPISSVRSGTFTLVSGSATVTNANVSANTVVHVTLKTASGTRAGNPDIVPTSGTGFTASAASSDNSTYNYWLEGSN